MRTQGFGARVRLALFWLFCALTVTSACTVNDFDDPENKFRGTRRLGAAGTGGSIIADGGFGGEIIGGSGGLCSCPLGYDCCDFGTAGTITSQTALASGSACCDTLSGG